MGAFSIWHWIIVLLVLGLPIVIVVKLARRGGPESGASRFRNPANGYEEDVSLAWLWCLLFGSIYFAVKGVWGQAIISFILAPVTLGISWLVYPFIAHRIVARNYLRKGWVAV